MKKIYAILFYLLLAVTVYASDNNSDTNKVISLNISAYKNHLTKPNQTIADADKALTLAIKLNYQNGIAEAYRIKGIGEYYLNLQDSAFNHYNKALEIYKKWNNERGEARVFNNIGNLYQLVDYDKALENFGYAEAIAVKYKDKQLIASLYLNMGNIYNRQAKYSKALQSYNKSKELFTELKNPEFLVQSLENLGVIYYNLHQLDTAKSMLLDANEKAKKMDMNSSIVTIDMNLTDIYITEGNYERAQKYIGEGKTYAELIKNDKDINDYIHLAYELEIKRKNYKGALDHLIEIYKSDSAGYKSNVSTRLNFLIADQNSIVQNLELQRNKAISRVTFWAGSAIAVLLLTVIALLISNVRRKATTNTQLQELNNEISRQKDNLDRINHHLEEIIDERTKDLQVKNKKLSEYSSYLSHQIRGPIATLKGLMNLEKEGLVDKQECINMMDKCVSEIDEKIIEMSDMLHDPGKTGF